MQQFNNLYNLYNNLYNSLPLNPSTATSYMNSKALPWQTELSDVQCTQSTFILSTHFSQSKTISNTNANLYTYTNVQSPKEYFLHFIEQ